MRNPFWMIFICFIMVGMLGYTTYSAIKLWRFAQLNEQVRASASEWSISSVSDDSFTPFARYSFRIKEKQYVGQTLWNQAYLNLWAAQEAIGRLENNPPLVWYNSSSPETSSLQKIFPLKECLYSVFLWGLCIYFFYLRFRFIGK